MLSFFNFIYLLVIALLFWFLCTPCPQNKDRKFEFQIVLFVWLITLLDLINQSLDSPMINFSTPYNVECFILYCTGMLSCVSLYNIIILINILRKIKFCKEKIFYTYYLSQIDLDKMFITTCISAPLATLPLFDTPKLLLYSYLVFILGIILDLIKNYCQNYIDTYNYQLSKEEISHA